MRHFDDRLRLLFVAYTLAGSLGTPTAASAAGVSPGDGSAEQIKEATARFAAGKQALEAKDYEQAISNLRASLEVVDSPNAHLELARALRDSGKLGDAWIEFGRTAETAARLAPREDRYLKTADAAVYERREVAGRLAFVAITVAHASADATLNVGGRIVPAEEWSAPVVVPPGAVDVVLADSGGTEVARRTVSALVGQTTSVALDGTPALMPPAKAADLPEGEKPGTDDGEQPRAPDGAAPQAEGSALRPLSYVAAGVGVAGVATFTVFGLMSNSTYNDLKGACPHGCPTDKRSEIDSGIAQQTIANVGLVVGLVGLAAGTTMFLLSMPTPAASSRTALFVAPMYQGGYVGFRGSL